MNQTHIHLLITHLPIFGSILGAMVLMYGMQTRSDQTKIAAYLVMTVSSVGAGIAYATGEGAEESVEHLSGVFKSSIHEHEEFALIALISLLLLGLSSLVSIYITIKKISFAVVMSRITLLIALVSFGLIARTGYLGGQIRHSELLPTSSVHPTSNSDQENEKESD